MRINNNIMAMNTHRQYAVNNGSVAKSTERLSSGRRINRAGDDAAGLAISEKMRAQIRGLQMASKNSEDAISLVQTAEGALTETHSILQRMRELAVQSASDTNDQDVDRAALNEEFQALRAEIDDIANKTTFNTKNLLTGDLGGTSAAVNTASDIRAGVDNVTSVGVTGFGAASATGETQEITFTRTAEGTPAETDVVINEDSTILDLVDADGIDIQGLEAGGTITFSMTAGTDDEVDFAYDAAGLAEAGNIEDIDFEGFAPGVENTVVITKTDGEDAILASAIDVSSQVLEEAGVIDDITFGNGFAVGQYTVSFEETDDGIYTAILKDSEGGTISTVSDVEIDPEETVVLDFGEALTVSITTGDTFTAAALDGKDLVFNVTVDTPATPDTYSARLNGGDEVAVALADGVVTLNFGDDRIVTITPTEEGFTLDDLVGTLTFEGEIIPGDDPVYSAALGEGPEAQVGAVTVDDVAGTITVSFGDLGMVTITPEAGFDAVSLDAATLVLDVEVLAPGTPDVYAATYGAEEVEFTVGNGVNTIELAFEGGTVAIGTGALFESSSLDDKTLAFDVTGEQSLIQTGANQGDSLNIAISDMRSAALNLGDALLTSQTDAANAITTVNNAINTVSAERSKLGALQNRLEHKISNLDTSAENLQAAESRIRDLDMAKEMTIFTQNNILVQAATAMLAQANAAPQNVLSLLG